MNNKISIVIPNWNGKHFLRACLESIRNQTYKNFEVIIVDNGSDDGSIQYINDEFPESKIVKFEKNLGFAVAVNAGIKASKGDFVFLLNNDTELEADCLEVLSLAAANSEAGMFACKMLYFDERELICDAGDGYSIYGYAYQRGNRKADIKQFDNDKSIFSACAGAALYRKELFEVIGFFDEDFFAYLEDIDLSFRAQLAGFTCEYVPGAIVYHVDGGTSKKLNNFTAFYSYRNNLFVLAKNMPTLLLFFLLPFILVYQIREFIFSVKEKKVGAFVKSYKDFFYNLSLNIKKRREIQSTRKVSSLYLFVILSKKYPFHLIRAVYNLLKKIVRFILIDIFGIKILNKKKERHE